RWPRDWSSDVCSSDLSSLVFARRRRQQRLLDCFRGLRSLHWFSAAICRPPLARLGVALSFSRPRQPRRLTANSIFRPPEFFAPEIGRASCRESLYVYV